MPEAGVPLQNPWASYKPKAPTADEMTAAASRYQAERTPAAADAYLSAVRPVLDEGVKAYAGGATSPAVTAKAKAIALSAAAGYDPARAKLKTLPLTQLQGLRRYAARAAAPARVPEQTSIDAQRIDRHSADLRAELGRDPSDAELADRTHIPIQRIARARGTPAAFAWSTAPEGVDLVAPSADKKSREAWARFVYHDLGAVDQLVMEHTLGMNGKPVLSTSALARMVGVTPGAISQRKSRIDKLMGEYHSVFGG